jgi:hypothetical protein
MGADPGPEASLPGGLAPRCTGSQGRLDLAFSVRLDHPEPLLAEHDLPLSPFIYLQSFDVLKLPEKPARTCHERWFSRHP